VYLDLRNPASADDRLLRLTSPVSSSVQLHETTDNHGVMRMRQLPFVDVPTGVTVKAAPGALHIMLLGLKKPLLNGDTFPLTLVFANAGELSVQVRVRTDR
jgi:copper(I)-binding protein